MPIIKGAGEIVFYLLFSCVFNLLWANCFDIVRVLFGKHYILEASIIKVVPRKREKYLVTKMDIRGPTTLSDN